MSANVCEQEIDRLMQFCCTRYGLDFSRYRSACVCRRVAHRMAALGYGTMDEYIAYFETHPEEAEMLLDVVTIHTTGFFRDRDVFDVLMEDFLPDMIERKRTAGERSIRAWSAGCSTGEEAYSLAILLAHLIHSAGVGIRVEVFGTDISEEACRIARRGVYSERRITGVPLYMKTRYFELAASGYAVDPKIRRLVKFASHDIFSKPPYSMLDLIVCRNVMIHFDHQERGNVLTNFFQALNEEGLLVLGKSEAVTGSALEQFALIYPRSKIYRKQKQYREA